MVIADFSIVRALSKIQWPVMSEQYPLLYEDLSDEERLNPRYRRQRGRAKYHLKGAAAVMKRWPEHWTSLLTYWWIGLGMIAITTFIIYNTLFSIALSQPTNKIPLKHASIITQTAKSKHISPPGIFMHVFVDDKEEENLNKYIPYIEVFANKYKDFTYNLIIVANDTSEETINLTQENNNQLALDSLWTDDRNYGNLVPSNSNIKVKYVTLSKYLNQSPIAKYWKHLPYQFIRFLVRAVSVWEKGGIAINPIILTPQSPHATYMNKFMSIIKNFKINTSKISSASESKKTIGTSVNIPAKNYNNIRDIINALENDASSEYLPQDPLHVAETHNEITIENLTSKILVQQKSDLKAKHDVAKDMGDSTKDSILSKDASETDKSPHMLPLFLDYLFHNRKSNDTFHSSTRRRRSPTAIETKKDNHNIQMRDFWNELKISDSYKPMIVSAKGITNKTITNSTKATYENDEELFELTVDLKGNIIATGTPCHAFLGNMFTNAIHHDEMESLTDFIIKELSIFCKGLLASCVGIDVILV